MQRKFSFSSVVLLGLAALAGGAEPAPHAHAAHGMAGAPKTSYPELGATAAFDRHGTLWAAHKTAGAVTVSQSRDLGKTWSSPVLVGREVEPTDAGGDARPKIALGPKDEVYVTWTRPMTKPYTGEIRFTRSLDGGRTYARPVTVHADRQEITHRFDALAVTPQGRVFVAWIDKRDLVAGAANYRGAALYFATSDDQGTTFGGDRKLADHACECCRISLVAEASGAVVALWRHIFAPNIRDHALARIEADGQVGPVERASFDEWAIDACPHQGPALAAGANGRWHTVWFTGSAKGPGVYYGRRLEGRGEAQRKVGGPSAQRPHVASLGRKVAVVWKEFDGTRTQLCAMTSNDDGETWRELRIGATTEASDHPQLVTWQNRFYAFWNTRLDPLSVIPLP